MCSLQNAIRPVQQAWTVKFQQQKWNPGKKLLKPNVAHNLDSLQGSVQSPSALHCCNPATKNNTETRIFFLLKTNLFCTLCWLQNSLHTTAAQHCWNPTTETNAKKNCDAFQYCYVVCVVCRLLWLRTFNLDQQKGDKRKKFSNRTCSAVCVNWRAVSTIQQHCTGGIQQ